MFEIIYRNVATHAHEMDQILAIRDDGIVPQQLQCMVVTPTIIAQSLYTGTEKKTRG